MGRGTSRPSWRALAGGGALLCAVLFAFAWMTRAENTRGPGGEILSPWKLDDGVPLPSFEEPIGPPRIARIERPRAVEEVPANDPVQVTLELVAAQSGEPLPGSLVVTSAGTTRRLEGPNARITLPPGAEVGVRASAWGHFPHANTRRVAATDETWTVALDPRPGLHGRVICATPEGGAAVSDLHLELAIDGPLGAHVRNPRTRTNALGSYYLVADPGRYRLVARLADGRLVRGPRVEIGVDPVVAFPWILPYVLENVVVGRPGRGPERVGDLVLSSDEPNVHLVNDGCDARARATILHRAGFGATIVLTGRNGHGETFRAEHVLREARAFRGVIERP